MMCVRRACMEVMLGRVVTLRLKRALRDVRVVGLSLYLWLGSPPS